MGVEGSEVTDRHAQFKAWPRRGLRKGWWRDMYWSLLEAKAIESKGCKT